MTYLFSDDPDGRPDHAAVGHRRFSGGHFPLKLKPSKNNPYSVDVFLIQSKPGPNQMNGLQAYEYKSFSKSLLVTSKVKFNLLS